MRRRPRTGLALVGLALLCAAGGPAAATAAAARHRHREPVRLAVRFDAGARLGGATAVDVLLRLDLRRLTRAPLTEVRFAYPSSLGIVSSGLGLATCTRPASDFVKVLIVAPPLGGCSPNAVMGTGTAIALVRLTTGQEIPEYATVTLLSGAYAQGRLGLVVYVDGQRPFGAKLAFAGDVRDAPRPYGGALAVRLPPAPSLVDLATISLAELHLVLGAHTIRYYERRRGRRVAYHPDGIALPPACPADGFRFRTWMRFADGTRRSATTVTACPPAAA
ncbi:MAG: hypothetical protein JSS99_04475 [Actinobacteria bacterium]|nr:hypothetical protein [Actinomycetota bacterium]